MLAGALGALSMPQMDAPDNVFGAGMNVAAGPRLAAAVTNAGGIGVIGGLRQTPKVLQDSIDEIKANLEDKNAPFGVDLLIPQVGGKARKTNVRKFLPVVQW